MKNWEKKYNEDGLVAVLYSPGYGGGWSTWTDYADDDDEDRNTQAKHDSRVVDLVLADKKDMINEEFMESIGLEHFYTGGAAALEVEWMWPGTLFNIKQHGGYESIVYEENYEWSVA